MTTKRELCEILKDLSSEELEDFNRNVELEKGVQLLSKHHPEGTNAEDVVELMVEKYSEDCMELTKNVFKKMNRTDLVQRLSDSSTGSKEKHSVQRHPEAKQWPSLIQRVEMITSDIEVLMDVLADLTEEEIGYFRNFLKQTPIEIHKSYVPWWQLLRTDPCTVFVGGHQETVFLMIMTCGQHSVETTRGILKKMERTDLLQRLTDTSSRLKKKESDEQCSALIQKVATMSAVQQLLSETLHCLSQRELSEFKKFLKEIVFKKGLKTNPLMWRHGVERQGLVDQMMMTCGQQSVELTRGVLEEITRSDLIQMLSESSSALQEKNFVDRYQPALLEECLHVATSVKTKDLWTSAVKEDAEWILFQTLRGLSFKELEKFMFLLKFAYFQRSLPQIQTESGHQLEELVYLMVENQHPVEVTIEVLMDMNRSDLVERLSGISSGLKGPSPSEHLQKEPSSLHWTVFKTLRGLSYEEFEEFKHLMLRTALDKDFPGVRGTQGADRVEMAKLIVKTHGQQCVEVTADVLQKVKRTNRVVRLSVFSSRRKSQRTHQSRELQKSVCKAPKDLLEMITRMDLEEKLSESSSGSQGPSGSLEPEACGGSTNPCQTDSSPWTKLEPGVNSSGGHESPSYSLQSETGNYECSVSGLRWVCEEEVSFQYHFCSWGGHMERMESIKYMPAGPLIDIKVITGRLNEVYLPHWICTEDDSKISDNYKVLHIDECGDVVENVSEVTPSHVKLSEPVFSPRGVLMKVGFPVKIRCSVLIYYKPNTSFLKLRVYLIPCDPALQQTVDKKELSKGFQTIEKPRPDKYLKMQKGFSLMAKTANVNPKKITLRYDNQDPNFYEVFIEKPNGIFQLELFYISKKEVESEPVWTCEIREDDYQSSASEDKHSVDDQLSAQMQSLTNRMQAVTISTTDRERLLKTLEDLTQEEFKEFKWYLRDKGVLTGLTSISKRKLESKDVLELVDLMFGTYRKHCMELTRRVLRAMDKNDLVETLSDIS